jgi:hypothetical protein
MYKKLLEWEVDNLPKIVKNDDILYCHSETLGSAIRNLVFVTYFQNILQ